MGCPDETTLSDFLVGLLSEQRRAEVLAHVEGCASCQRALAAGEDSAHGSEALEAGEAVAALPPGATLARYVVRERIGQGSMGVVYAAYDPELNRRVALKLLRPEGRHLEELRRRLLREAQALARLSHPNVVSVHDVGTCGDGLFLAMDLVEGTTLAEWLHTPRPWREVLRVFVEAGRGLAAAHAAGLVHRDFKPANVLVGHQGQVRVTDFGLASTSEKPAEPLPPQEPRREPQEPHATRSLGLTRTGAVLGTPAYMAPEQLQGSADALSDQFSFCVALHEALHGERPFQGDSSEELLRAAREGRMRAPSREAKVPAWVRRAVRRGLRARPEERFPSMEALLAALNPRPRRVLARVAASAAVASLVGVALGYVGAHRREVRCAEEADKLAAAWSPERRERVHAAFLATGKPFAVSSWEKVSATLDAHASQWRTRRTEACLAAAGDPSSTAWQTTTCLDTRLWQLAAITEVLEKADMQTVQNAPQMLASLEGLVACEDASAFATRPRPPEALRPQVDAARRRLAEARARLDAGNHAQAIEMTSALLKEIQPLDFRPLEAEVLTLHGHLHAFVGKPKEGEEILYRALWAAEASHDDETAARVWILLISVVGDQMARVEEADRLVQHARAAVERLGHKRFPAITADLHLRLGGLLLVEGKLQEADAEFSQGLELSREVYGPESLRTSYFISGLGRVRARQTRSGEALVLYRQAQELRERQWGPDHPALALNLSNMASEMLSLGRPEEALAAFRRSLALLEAARSPEHPSLAAPLNNLAALLRRRGQLEEARRHFERALAIFERSKGRDHPNTTVALCGLGMVAYDSQDLDGALAYAQESLERLQRTLGPDTPRAATPLEILGRIHLQAGRYDEARKHLTRALQLLEKEHGADSAVTASTLRALARLELATGAPRVALERCQRALKLDEQAQGAENPDVALGLACVAETHLALRAPEQAVPLLEQALRIHQRSPLDSLDEAQASFLLARALWTRQKPSEREHALALAREARTLLEAQKPRGLPELKQVTAWLDRYARAEHGEHP